MICTRFDAPAVSSEGASTLAAMEVSVGRPSTNDPVNVAAARGAALPASVLLNLALTWPVYGLARRLFPVEDPRSSRVREVRVVA